MTILYAFTHIAFNKLVAYYLNTNISLPFKLTNPSIFAH